MENIGWYFWYHLVLKMILQNDMDIMVYQDNAEYVLSYIVDGWHHKFAWYWRSKQNYYGLLKYSNKAHTSIAAYTCNILQVTKPDDKGLQQKF